MAQLYSNCMPFGNSNSGLLSESLLKTLSSKDELPQHLYPKVRQLSFQLHDRDSSSSQSTHSNHELAAVDGKTYRDQYISSESGQEASCGGRAEQPVKAVFLMGQPNATFDLSRIDHNRTMTRVPHPCTDPCFSGLLAAFGPPPMIQPQMVGMTPARVPLPFTNIAEDEPIYVNPKQYHGILRRRQCRAKLEAANKLVKVRKRYLHESRHRHALNRVRGSGGRFLSSKKLEHGASVSNSDGVPSGPGSWFGLCQPNGAERVTATPLNSSSGMPHLGDGSSVFQELDRGFLGTSATHMGGDVLGDGELIIRRTNQHYAPVLR